MLISRPILLLLAAATLAGPLACGSLQEECDALARAYAAALQEARKCSPGSPDPCNVSVQAALDTDCAASVVAGGETRLNEIAGNYATRGCPSQGVTSCLGPAIQDFTCQADASGAFRCTAIPSP